MHIIDQPNDLAPDRNEPQWVWSDQESNLFRADVPWYSGSNPIFKIADQLVVGLIRWGSGGLKVAFKTEPCETFSEARRNMVDFTRLHFDREKVDWNARARSSGSIKGSVSFENCAQLGAPSYVCLVSNLPNGKMVRSSEHKSKQHAFEEAIELARSILKSAQMSSKSAVVDWEERKASVAPPPKRVRSMHADSNQAQNELTRLLGGAESAKHEWLVEHAWLLKRVSRNPDEERRLKQLNEFLILCDPLRKFEIDQGSLPSIFKGLMAELQIRKARASADGVLQLQCEMLRALAGKKFAEPGTNLSDDIEFKDACGRRGLRPNEVLALLKSWHLVRIDHKGGLSMSSPGANLLEKMLEKEHGPNSLASRLGLDTLVQLGEAVRRH